MQVGEQKIEEEKKKIAKELLDLGIDTESITKATGLTKEEIQKIKKNIFNPLPKKKTYAKIKEK